jgi:hypothetical protein
MPNKTKFRIATLTAAFAITTLFAPVASVHAQGFPGAKQRDSSPSDSKTSPQPNYSGSQQGGNQASPGTKSGSSAPNTPQR